MLLYLNIPLAPVGLCAVVPLGTCTASVAEPISSDTAGVASRIPTRLFELSTTSVFVSTVKSPDIVADDNVPTLVMLGCAAVDKVPASSPLEP